MRLPTGSIQDRFWAAVIAGRGDDALYRGVLISLIADDNAQVRAAACSGLARVAAQGNDPLVHAALRTCAEDPGRAVGIQLANGLGWLSQSPTSRDDDIVAQLRDRLGNHPSAQVRDLAAE